jgi:hypothetical protein
MRLITTILALLAFTGAAFGQNTLEQDLPNDWQEDVLNSTSKVLTFKPYVAPTEMSPVEPARMTIDKAGVVSVENWRWCFGEAIVNGTPGKVEVENGYGSFLNFSFDGLKCTTKFRVRSK